MEENEVKKLINMVIDEINGPILTKIYVELTSLKSTQDQLLDLGKKNQNSIEELTKKLRYIPTY